MDIQFKKDEIHWTKIVHLIVEFLKAFHFKLTKDL